MSKPFLFASLFILAAVGLTAIGCAKQEASQKPSTPPQAQPAATASEGQAGHEEGDAGMAGKSGQDMPGMAGHDMAGMTEHAADTTENKYKDALAQLPPEDQALAEKQKVCPVSGQPLGIMGKPYKVTVEGRDVLLCCPNCEAKIKANPQEYLAKLPQ